MSHIECIAMQVRFKAKYFYNTKQLFATRAKPFCQFEISPTYSIWLVNALSTEDKRAQPHLCLLYYQAAFVSMDVKWGR